MDEQPEEWERRETASPGRGASIWVLGILVGLALAGGFAYTLLKPNAGPPPRDIASDPLLVEGRKLFLERCASCHGETGVGDGPVARINEVPPGNLTDDEWKYGDRPQDLTRVIGTGIQGAMPGWDKTFGEPQLIALAAYVYYLAGRDVPPELHSTTSETDRTPTTVVAPEFPDESR